MGSFLIFNFDGTGNEPEDAKQEVKYKAKQEDDNISNVLKLHLMMGGNLFLNGEKYGQSDHNTIDHCFYYQGVGTNGSWVKRAINQGLALESCDVASILNKAKADFNKHYKQGDIVLATGFSRGAALARRFVGLIAKEHPKVTSNSKPFVFLCVFDTVASIGLPNLSTASRPDYDVVFEYGCTLSHIVKKAIHMVSLDDKRRAFQPTLMNYDQQRIHEIWFAGAHSDVGGGYYRDGLSDITLSHAMKWLEYMTRYHALPAIQFKFPTQTDIDNACPTRLKGMIGLDDLQRNPNSLGKNHQQDRWPIVDWVTLDDRRCCVIEEDKINEDLLPVIHYAVAERLHRDDDYRPKSLMNKRHYLWYDFINPPVDCPSYTQHIHYAAVNWEELDVAQSVERMIDADRFYNFTGIVVKQGEEYEISVREGDSWHDGKEISCDGDGWNLNLVQLGLAELPIRAMKGLRRVPSSDWFTLCAVVDSDDDNARAVGQNGVYRVTKTGELQFFANDLKFKYGNNSGSLRVRIERVK
nr:DUF2235 domain-containing protein [uncultured Vibrio sp.]